MNLTAWTVIAVVAVVALVIIIKLVILASIMKREQQPDEAYGDEAAKTTQQSKREV